MEFAIFENIDLGFLCYLLLKNSLDDFVGLFFQPHQRLRPRCRGHWRVVYRLDFIRAEVRLTLTSDLGKIQTTNCRLKLTTELRLARYVSTSGPRTGGMSLFLLGANESELKIKHLEILVISVIIIYVDSNLISTWD